MKYLSSTAKNFSIVLFSNIITLMRGVVTSLLIPKILSIQGYADYKLFAMYASYVGLLHFGFIDGICVKYAGKSISETGTEKYRLFSRLLLFIEIICAVLLLVIYCEAAKESHNWVVLLAIYAVIHNMSSYFASIFQVTMQFNKYAISGILSNIFQFLSVAILYVVLYFGFQTNYILFFVISEGLYLFICIILQINIVFGRAERLNQNIGDIKEIFSQGFPLMVGGIVSTIILNLDRQFISVLFSKTDYAIYSFAYTMINLFITLLSAMSVVLYPLLKQRNNNDIRTSYIKLCNIIVMLTFGCLACLPIMNKFIIWFLPQYEESTIIIVSILPAICTLTLVQVIIINYFKLIEKTAIYLVVSVCVLIASFVFNIGAYYIFHSMQSIAVATVVTCFVWVVSGDCILRRWLNIKEHTFLYYVFIMSIAYYLCFLNHNNYMSIISMFVYIGIYIIGIRLYLFKIKRVKNENK